MTVLIGASGWQYRHWRGTVYPEKLAQKHWFGWYVQRFQTVEINNSFYRQPPPETFDKWRERSPDDFIITVKANRFMTHIRRLKNTAESVQIFSTATRRLGSKLGPVLLQLPPNLQVDLENLDETLSHFNRDTFRMITAEPRHASWWTDDFLALLRKHDVALCWADRGEQAIAPVERTSSWGYVRLHQGNAYPMPCYERATLTLWAERIAERFTPDDDVYVYFNNDPRGCAIEDAISFAEECEKVGLRPTRVPQADEITVAKDDEQTAWATSS